MEGVSKLQISKLEEVTNNYINTTIQSSIIHMSPNQNYLFTWDINTFDPITVEGFQQHQTHSLILF